MIDRRALVIGSWLTQEQSPLSNQKVIALTNHWTKIFKNKVYGFKSLTDENKTPVPLHNPTISQLTSQFEDAKSISADTELLLYYLGDSLPSGEDDIKLTLGDKSKDEIRTIELSVLLRFITYLPESFNKLVLILDTCHAGRTLEVLGDIDPDHYAMLASDSGYAFDARFTEGIFKAFEDPFRKRDQRLDRREGGMTYQKVFEYATEHVLRPHIDVEFIQKPISFGEYEGDLLIEGPDFVPNEYVKFTSKRSIYGRVYLLLEMIVQSRAVSIGGILKLIRSDRSFLIKTDDDEGEIYLSQKRITDYLNFLQKIEWLEKSNDVYQPTDSGIKALDQDNYNRILLEGIENLVLPTGFDFVVLDEIVMNLLDDMIPPTPIKIQERSLMKGYRIYLNPGVRVALQILPSTGRFLKGTTDAIYPAEL